MVWNRADSAKGPSFWKNTWEIDLGIGGFWANDLQVVAEAFGDFHRALLLPFYYVDHVVISTIAEDGEPYNPDTFATVPINLPGTMAIDPSATALPLTNVLHVRKNVVRGRPGKLMLRGVLNSNDIETVPGGVVRLINQAQFSAFVQTQYAALRTALGLVVPSLVGSGLAATPRPVESCSVAGLSYNPARRAVKTKVPATSPLAQMAGFIGDLQNVAEVMNPIIQAYNALPLPDVPLLGD